MTEDNSPQSNSSRIRISIMRIAELSGLVFEKEPHWKVSGLTLFPPALEADIEHLSLDRPFPLPTSYKNFLLLSDGCLNFWPRFALLGTKGEPRELIEKKVADAGKFLAKYAGDKEGNLTAESIAAFEAPTLNGQEFFLPNHLVFGNNRSSEFFMFNDTVESKPGEYEVVHYNYSGGVNRRFADFPSFLSETIKDLESRIKEKGYSSK
jgi:hypothetical protein